KARRHPKRLRRIVSARFQVLFHSPPGVLFTFPSRYLSAIGQEVVFRLTRWSWQIHTGFHGPGATREQRRAMQKFSLRGSHPLRRRTHHDFDYHYTSTPMSRQTHQTRPTTPNLQPLPGITQTRFSLLRFRSPLLTESLLFSLPAGTEMFHFPAFPPRHLYIQQRVPRHDSWWVSPFGHPRITVRLSTPRGLTQTPTSFVGSSCQGIHRAPFKTYGNTKTLCAIKIAYKMLASTMQFSKNNPTPPPPTQQSVMEGRTSHTPHTPDPPRRAVRTVEPRAASQPNSVSPPQTTQPLSFHTPKEGRTRKDCAAKCPFIDVPRSEEHTSELQSRLDLVCRLL